MRTLLAVMLALLPLIQAQDSLLLKSVEPNYDKYSEDLATDFSTAGASVTIAVLANGKPFALNGSSVPLPIAVVMALKEYEFRPQGTIPHGRPAIEGETYQVTLNVPIRQSKEPVSPSAIRIGSGIAKGLLIRQVRAEYPEDAKHNRIQGLVTLETVITKQGYVGGLKTSSGPFALIEAAYNAVKQWQYRPYMVNRQPVEVLANIEINFSLK